MRLPSVFKNILTTLRLSQKEFAATTLLPLNSIRHISSGRRPRKDTLEIILEHLPVEHQGELLAAWIDDSIPDQHRGQVGITTSDVDPDNTLLVANNPTAMAARDVIFQDLCLPRRKAFLRIKQAAQKDPEVATRLRALAKELL